MMPQLDDFVEAYEAAREQNAGPLDLREFAPSSEHPEYCQIVVELIRVDLENSWTPGRTQALDDYRDLFPEVVNQPECLERIAFEEYRLRCQAGAAVGAAEYQQRYGIDVRHWPDLSVVNHSRDCLPASSRNTAKSRHDTTLSLGGPADSLALPRLADLEHLFPQVGQCVGEFELLGVLGQGSFARVFLARQAGLAGRLVALKFSAAGNIEPQHLAQLQHTHIVPIYSCHHYGPLQVICMPYLGNVTLADISRQLEQRGSLPSAGRELLELVSVLSTRRADETLEHAAAPAQSSGHSRLPPATLRTATFSHQWADDDFVRAVIWMMARVAEGLGHAHEQGVLHCDLKPANILITDRGQPLLLDFNVAAEHRAEQQLVNAVGGTLHYMSPEQLRSLTTREPIGAPSDIYALGVILAELLIGRRLFPVRQGTWSDLLPQMVSDRQSIPALRPLNRQITPGLESIIRRCLAIEPQQRYVTAKQLQQDLNCFLAHAPLRTASDPSLAERGRKFARRHPRFFSGASVAAAAALLLIAALVAWHVRGVQLEEFQAASQWEILESKQPQLIAALSTPGLEAALRQRFRQEAKTLLLRYGATSSSDWQHSQLVTRLPVHEQHRLLQAVVDLQFWLESDPANAGELPSPASSTNESAVPDQLQQQRRAGLLLSRREYQAALDILQQLTAQQPHNFVAWFWSGRAYAGLGRFEKARDCFSVCLTLAPDSSLAYLCRGNTYLDQEHYAEASDDFAAALRLDPPLIEAHLKRAMSLHGAGRTEAAIAQLGQLITRGNGPAAAYFLRSSYYRATGNREAAAADLKLALQQAPDDDIGWVQRGVARLAQNPQDALHDFEQALQLNPYNRAALQNAAHVLSERLNRLDEAIQRLDQLIALRPHDPLSRASQAVLLARAKRFDAAEAMLQVALLHVNELPRAKDQALVWYQAACVAALTATADEQDIHVITHRLATAFRLDQRFVQFLASDADLASIREDGRIQALAVAAASLLKTAGETPAPHRPPNTNHEQPSR